jgi:hypothetical protein
VGSSRGTAQSNAVDNFKQTWEPALSEFLPPLYKIGSVSSKNPELSLSSHRTACSQQDPRIIPRPGLLLRRLLRDKPDCNWPLQADPRKLQASSPTNRSTIQDSRRVWEPCDRLEVGERTALELIATSSLVEHTNCSPPRLCHLDQSTTVLAFSPTGIT